MKNATWPLFRLFLLEQGVENRAGEQEFSPSRLSRARVLNAKRL
jgi:hypothetical protein